ncbi:MAG: hypothetical protein H6811_04475 [Phycisphaeraceae bacterium]|nr:hypothetical protein [Phycisphaeraceae bacterium]
MPACGARLLGTRYELRSIERPVATRPVFRLKAYSFDDANTADLYFTDLERDALRGDLKSLTGELVHVHLFVEPKAGKTPIQSTAVNAAVTHIVMVSGEAGVYSGGGFLSTAGTPGDGSLGGTMSGGTLRLERATPGFADLLGASRLDASLSAPLDPMLAGDLASIVRILVSKTPRVE